MDGALLLIAANETCPQPQTSEHLAAVEIMRLEHIIILQNKIDLIRYRQWPFLIALLTCKFLGMSKLWSTPRVLDRTLLT